MYRNIVIKDSLNKTHFSIQWNLADLKCLEPLLHGDSDPDPDPDWLRLHGGKLDSNPDSDHLTHMDCDPDSNPDSGPGAHVNAA